MHKSLILLLLLPLFSARATDCLERPLPDSYTTSLEGTTLPSADAWWHGFNDPLLDSLISEAEDANLDLAMAARRMDAARHQVEAARAAYMPVIGINASYSRERTSGVNANAYSLGATMSWEIDIFGKVRAAVKADRAAYQASHAAWASAMVSLCSQVAATYVDLRVQQAELDVARRHIERQDTIAEIARARYECGLASKIDLDQALSVLYSTRAELPSLEAAVKADINALALLLGVYPEEISTRLSAAPLPEYTRLIATGVPADLLRRRPDIVEAEQQIERYAALAGVARKAYLPSLTLQGSVGVGAPRPGDMFTSDGFNYAITPTLSWTLFDGMERRANAAIAVDNLREAVDSYNYTVMNAYTEVDNAIESYRAAIRQAAILEQCVSVSQEFLDLSLDLYTQGLAEFTRVANAQVDLLNYNLQLVTARGNALTSLITLYKALGGGYDDGLL